MSEPATNSNDARTRDRSNDVDASRPIRKPLEAVVVTEENRPDRRTIYPADSSNEVTRTAWLTADATAFDDLEDRR